MHVGVHTMHVHMQRLLDGRCQTYMEPTGPGPCVVHMFTSPGPHVILVWQGRSFGHRSASSSPMLT